MAKSIKDLKDLRLLRRRACYRHSGPTDLKSTRDVFSVVRTMARDRPSPYGEGGLSAAAAPGYCIETRRSLLPGMHRLHRDREVSPTGGTEAF